MKMRDKKDLITHSFYKMDENGEYYIWKILYLTPKEDEEVFKGCATFILNREFKNEK